MMGVSSTVCKGHLNLGWASHWADPIPPFRLFVCFVCVRFQNFAKIACQKDTQQPKRTLKVKG